VAFAITRREFTAGGAALFMAAAPVRAVRLGGPIFLQSDDPRELAREHRRLGYRAAYVPKVSLGDSARIQAIRDAFAAEDVVIAEVGAWVNMIDADPEKRRKNMQYVEHRLALAEEVGALCCVDIGGSYNSKMWDGPDPANLGRGFFDAMVANCRKLIDAVKPKRTRFTIEMMGWALPNTADSYLDLIKAVDRPAFGAHMDICNIIESAETYYHNAQVTRECFRKMGRHIVSCHAKDVGPRNTHIAEVIPGRGGLDYKAYLTEIAALSADVPLMLEHLETAAEYEEGAKYIRAMAAECGVRMAS
jgi:sugar phosphate isomerase/epimerase